MRKELLEDSGLALRGATLVVALDLLVGMTLLPVCCVACCFESFACLGDDGGLIWGLCFFFVN